MLRVWLSDPYRCSDLNCNSNYMRSGQGWAQYEVQCDINKTGNAYRARLREIEGKYNGWQDDDELFSLWETEQKYKTEMLNLKKDKC